MKQWENITYHLPLVLGLWEITVKRFQARENDEISNQFHP